MENFYSPSTGGFYTDVDHGARLDDKGAPSPDTKIPLDAVSITAEAKAALFDAQAQGKIITLVDGAPAAVDAAPVSSEQLAANLRATRDQLLAGSDWTQVQDAPLDIAKKSAWTVYRQALRDLPAKTPNPASVTWPEAPQ